MEPLSDTDAVWSLVAHNTATASANKIHDDSVARAFGFSGGLVPGVDVYAYLTHLPAATWGLDWLERGTMRGRFVTPVYDGERVTVTSTCAVGVGTGDVTVMVLELMNEAGDVCATGEATLAAASPRRLDVSAWPAVEQATDPPPAAPEVLTVGTAFGLASHGFHADRHGEYLDDVRDPLPLYRDERVAHPGWLLRDANYVLSSNVKLGPWIHVESVAQHHDAARDGDVVSARAIVMREWERKGHRFVELDVLHLANGDRPLARVTHTAIYQPRRTG